MGVWQGIAQAYKDISAERAREKEIREEREYQTKQKEEDRAFEREQYLARIREARRENLTKVLASRSDARSKSDNYVAKVKGLQEKLGETDDPRAAKVLSNPLAASAIFDAVEGVNIERAKNGLAPLSGTEILDNITYYDDDNNPQIVESPKFGLEDLDRIAADEEEYQKVMIQAARSQAQRPKPVVSVDPTLYDPRDPKRTKQAAEYFNAMVLQQAAAELQTLDNEAEGYSNLAALIEDATKNANGAGMSALQIKYGLGIYEDMIGSNDPNVNSIAKDPVIQNSMQKLLDIRELQTILNDPSSTEDEKAEAQALLTGITGIRRGR